MINLKTPHCFTLIRAVYTQLSEKEKSIADFILNYPEKIIHSTINQIAEEVGVADATVFRLTKRLGYKGYQSMKIALASEITITLKDIHETIDEGDDEKTIAEKVFKSNIRTLEDTLQVLDQQQLKQAVSALVSARKIEFYGNGGSGAIAMDAHHKFLRSGLFTSCYTDGHLQAMSAAQLNENDVVVCISHSGTSRDVMDALEIAKLNGATIIGITQFGKTPLSEKSDILLFTISLETEFRSEALASRLAQLSIIDALFVNVSIQLKESMKTSLQNLRNAIAVKRI